MLKVNHAAMLIILAGLVFISTISHSASTTCDTATFERFFLAPDGKTTLALTKTPSTWKDAEAAAANAGGRLVVITNAATNTAIFKNLSGAFTKVQSPFNNMTTAAANPQYSTKKAWVGLSDPLNTASWCVEGTAGCTTPADRFSWVSGTGGYANWAAGQPNGFCTLAEQASTSGSGCMGEPWAAMSSDGFLFDEGDHALSNPTVLKAIVEWPNTALDCAAPPLSTLNSTTGELLPGADTGTKWCSNADYTLTKCLETANGTGICPSDKTRCVSNADNTEVCPLGGQYSCVVPLAAPTSVNLTANRAGANITNGCHFGVMDSGVTVTVNDGGTVALSNSLCGNPDSTSSKSGYVLYSCGGTTSTVYGSEGDTLSIPCTSGDFTWIDGYYYTTSYDHTISVRQNALGAPTPTDGSILGYCSPSNNDTICGQTYCSANQCSNTTASFTSTYDTTMGANDKKNDGARDANGNCTGQIYLFSGSDMRCRKWDKTGMIVSYAELAGQIMLAASGDVTAMTNALADSMAGTIGQQAATVVAGTIVKGTSTLALDAGINYAVTGQTNVTLMSATMTLAMAGIETYMSTPNMNSVGASTTSVANGLETSMTTTATFTGDTVPGWMTQGMTEVGGTGQMVVFEGPAAVGSDGVMKNMQVIATPALGGGLNVSMMDVATRAVSPTQNMLSQATNLVSKYQGAIDKAMFGNYRETKCCYNDKLSPSCESAEMNLAPKVAAGQCHEVGEYCARKMLGICVVKKRTSCCFSSILARLIQEQGRVGGPDFSGLASFKGNVWGDPTNPNCRGFTPEEFQSLNIGAMDLTEYLDSIAAAENDLSPLVQQFIGQTTSTVETTIKDSDAYKTKNE